MIGQTVKLVRIIRIISKLDEVEFLLNYLGCELLACSFIFSAANRRSDLPTYSDTQFFCEHGIIRIIVVGECDLEFDFSSLYWII